MNIQRMADLAKKMVKKAYLYSNDEAVEKVLLEENEPLELHYIFSLLLDFPNDTEEWADFILAGQKYCPECKGKFVISQDPFKTCTNCIDGWV